MQYWWVNQNKTYKEEIEGGYLWSPQKNKLGHNNEFYNSMKRVSPGDFIFSYCDTRIKAIGIVQEGCKANKKPKDFQNNQWSNEGWLVPTKFFEIPKIARKRSKYYIDELKSLLPEKLSPLRDNGDGKEVVYLAPVPTDLALKLLNICSIHEPLKTIDCVPFDENELIKNEEEKNKIRLFDFRNNKTGNYSSTSRTWSI